MTIGTLIGTGIWQQQRKLVQTFDHRSIILALQAQRFLLLFPRDTVRQWESWPAPVLYVPPHMALARKFLLQKYGKFIILNQFTSFIQEITYWRTHLDTGDGTLLGPDNEPVDETKIFNISLIHYYVKFKWTFHLLFHGKRMRYVNRHLNNLLHYNLAVAECEEEIEIEKINFLYSKYQILSQITWEWHIFDHRIRLNNAHFNWNWNLSKPRRTSKSNSISFFEYEMPILPIFRRHTGHVWWLVSVWAPFWRLSPLSSRASHSVASSTVHDHDPHRVDCRPGDGSHSLSIDWRHFYAQHFVHRLQLELPATMYKRELPSVYVRGRNKSAITKQWVNELKSYLDSNHLTKIASSCLRDCNPHRKSACTICFFCIGTRSSSSASFCFWFACRFHGLLWLYDDDDDGGA